MDILKLSQKNYQSVIKQTISVLKNSGIIVYPTETAYGLGALAFNKKAVKKVYLTKARSFRKPLSVLMPNYSTVNKYLDINLTAQKLIKKYWPGPFTLILPIKKQWLKKFSSLTSGKRELAVRISSNKFAKNLVKNLKQPLTATSANLTGAGESYDIKEIIKIFKNKKPQPDLVIDAAKLKKRLPSTIVKIINKKIKVFRQGEIKI